ncbi:MAG TPA: inverse autotransporter beta domain-containing protein, partial [Hyphomicrobiales bacterium]|nr:inverse autotransporter beta domain-containing protein [Hyphomicrobiales bacterium]
MLRDSRFLKRIGVCVSCVSIFAANPVFAGDANSYWEGRKWEAWTEIGGYAANRSYARRGELTLWAPVLQDHDSLFFADLRGKLFAEDQEEGNAAIGYRFMRNDGWNPGFWIGLDRRNTESGTNFDQAAFGVEALSADWDFRINGYVPLNDRELVSSTTTGSGGGTPSVEVIGSSIFLVNSGSTTTDLYEIAMWGADAEIGWRVPLERLGYDPTWGLSLKDEGDASSGRHHELRLYAGGFYFDHSDFAGEVAGPRARAEWRIENIFEDWDGSRLTFEAAWQHDDVREHQIEGGLRLRIPLGGETGSSTRYALNAQERRMTEGLKRDTDIVSQSQSVVTESGSGGGGEQELIEDAETGVAFDTVLTVANGDNLQTGITTAGVNALVIALGGGSNFGAVTMQSDQTLLGGGGSIQVRGRTSGTVATYTAPGARPTIYGASSGIVITADNTHIAGIDADGTIFSAAIMTQSAGQT